MLQLLEPLHPRTRKHIVHKMPREILDIIFALLSVPDRICFSLTCKHVFSCLQSCLAAQKTQRSLLLPREERTMLCPRPKELPRNQLLLRLENERWIFCNDCWILHPRTPWWSMALLKPYCPECHLLQEQPCSELSSGEVDICPYLSITARDSVRLLETCKALR